MYGYMYVWMDACMDRWVDFTGNKEPELSTKRTVVMKRCHNKVDLPHHEYLNEARLALLHCPGLNAFRSIPPLPALKAQQIGVVMKAPLPTSPHRHRWGSFGKLEQRRASVEAIPRCRRARDT